MPITGDLVTLRPLEPSDTEALLRWHNDARVVQWMESGYEDSLQTITRRTDERVRNTYERLLLAICVDERAIGIVCLDGARPETGRAELTCYLGEVDTWGRGYATDAVRAICRHGFDEMRLHSVWLTVVAPNAAARKVYAKVGFREDGVLRDAFRTKGEWHDVVLMAVLEGELV